MIQICFYSAFTDASQSFSYTTGTVPDFRQEWQWRCSLEEGKISSRRHSEILDVDPEDLGLSKL